MIIGSFSTHIFSLLCSSSAAAVFTTLTSRRNCFASWHIYIPLPYNISLFFGKKSCFIILVSRFGASIVYWLFNNNKMISSSSNFAPTKRLRFSSCFLCVIRCEISDEGRRAPFVSPGEIIQTAQDVCAPHPSTRIIALGVKYEPCERDALDRSCIEWQRPPHLLDW